MNIGLNTKLKFGEENNLIKDILKGIDISLYNWVINPNSIQELYVINHDAKGFDRFITYDVDSDKDDDLNLYDYVHNRQKKVIPGELLLKEQIPDKYCFIFFSLFGYLKDKNISNIENYEDFSNSECDVFFSNYDSEYLTILIKDSVLLDLVKNNLEKIITEYIEEITNEYCKKNTNMFQ